MVSSITSCHIMRQALGIVLGGGRGTRLWPLTKYRAKPAVPLAGKYRLIDIPISNCLNSGLDRIYVFTQFLSSSLNRHIGRTYQLDPFSRGFVNLQVANLSDDNQNWYQGTADAVRRNLKELAQWRTPYVIILPGDTIFRMNLEDLLRFHIDNQAEVTISLHPASADRATGFGIVTLGEDNRIEHMSEKPSADRLPPLAALPAIRQRWQMSDDRPFLGSMGIYVFNFDLLMDLLRNPAMTDFGSDILPYCVSQGRSYGYVFNGYWEDIGTIRAFFESNLDLVKPNPPFQFYLPDAPIYTRMRFLPASQFERARLTRTKIAEGCIIQDAELDTCLVGLRSRVGRGARLRNTILMGADFFESEGNRREYEPVPEGAPAIGIGENCDVEGAIIDKNARVGAGCKLLNRDRREHYDDPDERYYIRDGIIIVPKHAILPPGTEI